MSLTVDEALRFADQQYTKQSFAGVLAAEVRRLSAENAATVRDAERYRALREDGVMLGQPHCLRLVHDEGLDAAADRLLEGE